MANQLQGQGDKDITLPTAVLKVNRCGSSKIPWNGKFVITNHAVSNFLLHSFTTRSCPLNKNPHYLKIPQDPTPSSTGYDFLTYSYTDRAWKQCERDNWIKDIFFPCVMHPFAIIVRGLVIIIFTNFNFACCTHTHTSIMFKYNIVNKVRHANHTPKRALQVFLSLSLQYRVNPNDVKLRYRT